MGEDLKTQLAWARKGRVVLRDLAWAISTLETPNELLDALSKRLGRALEADRALIYDVRMGEGLVVGKTEWLNPSVEGLRSSIANYPLAVFQTAAEWVWNWRMPLESHASLPSELLVADGAAAVLHEQMEIRSLLWFPFGFRDDGFHLFAINQLSGERPWSYEELELLADAAQQVEIAIGKLRVLQERTDAADEARRTADRLQLLVRSSPNAILMETADRRIQFANEAFCEVFAMERGPTELAGFSCVEGVVLGSRCFDEPDAFIARTQAIVDADRVVNAEELVTTDGRTIELDFVPIDAQSGGGRLWLFRDVSRQRGDAQQLRQLKRAIEQSPVAVLITDADGDVVYVNDRFTRLSGYANDEIAGQNPRLLKSVSTSAEIHRAMWATISAGKEWRGEFYNRHKSGRDYPIRASICPVFDEQRRITHYVATQEDMRAQYAAAAALAESEASRLRAHKMEAVARFAGGLACDFNNLMSVIQSYTGLAQEALTGQDEVLSDLGEVQLASGRAVALTRQLLALSRPDNLAPQDIVLDRALRLLLRRVEGVVGERVRVVAELGAHSNAVWVDEAQLEEAVVNLAMNAREAMPGGGTLTFRTRVVAVTPETTNAPEALLLGDYLVLTISDTGCGMTPETRARIFEPFFTTKAAGKGTGLDLALVYSFASQAHGAVSVESAPGRGAAFSIWMPRHCDQLESEEPSASQLVATSGSRELVLVIEDEAQVRDLVRCALGRVGYRVVAVSGGDEAKAWCTLNGATVQLVLCDVMMPGVHGPQLIEQLRPSCPTAKVIFMSGYVDRKHATLPPDAELIAKPFDVRTLERTVRAALDAP